MPRLPSQVRSRFRTVVPARTYTAARAATIYKRGHPITEIGFYTFVYSTMINRASLIISCKRVLSLLSVYTSIVHVHHLLTMYAAPGWCVGFIASDWVNEKKKGNEKKKS